MTFNIAVPFRYNSWIEMLRSDCNICATQNPGGWAYSQSNTGLIGIHNKWVDACRKLHKRTPFIFEFGLAATDTYADVQSTQSHTQELCQKLYCYSPLRSELRHFTSIPASWRKMMPPTTEVARFHIKSRDATNADAFHEALSTLSEQPGFIGTYYGMGVEDGDLLYWLIGISGCNDLIGP